MKFLTWVLSLLIFTSVYSNVDNSINSWQIKKKKPFLAYTAKFTLVQKDQSKNTIIRTGLLTPRYFYDLLDADGGWEVRGITQFLSWGMLSRNLMDIYLYDQKGFIGSIQGKFFTNARSKFIIFDEHNQMIANAYVNSESADFVVLNEDESKILAKLEGGSFGDVSLLDVKFQNELKFDARILKIFTAFVSDYHDYFIPRKTPDVYIYNNNNYGNNN